VANTSLSGYLDFEIEIGKKSGTDYPVRVVRSPAGEVGSTFTIPFDDNALQSHLKDIQIALLRSGWQYREILSPHEQAVKDFGSALFNSLFVGEVRTRFDVSQREALQGNKGLRVKFRILSPELAALPWEYLFDDRHADYVCLSRSTPVVRYVDLPQVIQPLTIVLPLRILGMIAGPKDMPLLNAGREKQRMAEALRSLTAAGLVELTWVEGQTWRDLQQIIRSSIWHVFHFIGHGGFDRDKDQGFIVLANEEGLSNRMGATQLGRLLADSSPRLVILNSCEQARASDLDVFSSTAATLVRRGIPAVLAMQNSISDWAAIEFSQSFYEALAEGMPVDATVTEARKAMSMALPNSLEWGTPVLFMRSSDGILFHLKQSQIKPKKPSRSTDLEEPVEATTFEPLPELSQAERDHLLNMKPELCKQVIGQEPIIQAVSKVIWRSYAGLRESNRPVGSFLFIGPGGVGKSLLAAALARYLYGSDRHLLEFQASEFMERHSVSRLVGSPPGYVGYEEGGQLTEAIRKRPESVVVFAEVEKAHPAVLDIIQGIAANGYMKDARGNRINFSRSVIIVKSRIGLRHFSDTRSVGFEEGKPDRISRKAPVEELVMQELKRAFNPEFLRSMDGILTFSQLEASHLEEIVELEIGSLAKKLGRRGVRIECSPKARTFLANKSSGLDGGARQVHRIVQEYLEDPLSEGYLAGRIHQGSLIAVDVEAGGEAIDLHIR
jgi:Cdc48 subfamily AAA family protein/CHAT domain-containing protein/ClpA/ClpB-like protein